MSNMFMDSYTTPWCSLSYVAQQKQAVLHTIRIRLN